MLQDHASSKENYERFIVRAKAQGEVYGLQAPDGGWAVCPSNEDDEADVIVFWSDRAYAALHQKEEWKDYVVTPVALDEFVEAWLKGMHEDGSIVGPNWDANLIGLEVEPIDVARRLTDGPAKK
jgi:hypothetical protein